MLSELKEHLDNMETYSALLASVEQIVGRPIDSQLMQDVFLLSEQYEFENDRIREFFKYLVSKGKFSHNYLVKVADTWKQNDICSPAEHEGYENRRLDELSESMIAIFNAFGMPVHIPTDAEQQLYDTWVGEYHSELSLILEACKITLDKIKSPSFAYAGAIISDWHKKNVHTLAQYNDMCEQERQKKENMYGKKFDKTKAIHNFTERTYDYDELFKSITEGTT